MRDVTMKAGLILSAILISSTAYPMIVINNTNKKAEFILYKCKNYCHVTNSIYVRGNSQKQLTSLSEGNHKIKAIIRKFGYSSEHSLYPIKPTSTCIATLNRVNTKYKYKLTTHNCR